MGLKATYPIAKGNKAILVPLNTHFVDSKGTSVAGKALHMPAAKSSLAYIPLQGRTIADVATTMAHEYRHCLQLNDGVSFPTTQGARNMPAEIQACKFSLEVREELVKQMQGAQK